MTRLGAVVITAAFIAACGGHSSTSTGECGDGVVDTGEDCDDGALNGTAGCTATCTFACADPAADCGAAPACQVAICTTDHVCIFIADSTQDGMSCGTGQVCVNGGCASSGACGNGVKEGTEECDFGSNNGAASGCEDNCKLSCADATACDDGNACNGAETCDVVTDTATGNTGKKCSPGSALTNGTTCGTNMLCINQVCAAASCGDSYTTSPEECDDANLVANDGCESTCKYSCLSTDTTRNCTPTDSCQGQGTCNDTTHVCAAGTPLANNTPCGTGGYCKNAVCTQPVCGNGTKEPGETCDDGNQTNGDGCDTDCTYSCVTPSTDCGTPPACQMYTCSATHVCQTSADTSKNGMSCGTNGETCNNGACTGGVCGDAVTESGEQCDFGTSSNGPNTGCETNCTYSCTISPNSCTDNNPCNGTELCAANMVNGHSGQKCNAGTPLADNTNCGTGKICKSQSCVASVCGDGYVDASIGETCEPPNTATCDSQCHPKVCGDGIRADTEQCDDGNLTNLDGCSSTCKFEQCQRIDNLKIQFGTDAAYCPQNALGTAAGSQAQSLITDAVDNGVMDGSITIFFEMMGLDDLTGTADPSLNMGMMGATPVAGTGYNGHYDLDWWYTVDTADLNASRVPTALVPATISAKTLNAGPSDMKFTVNFVGVDVTMNMFRTKMQGQIQASTTPTASTGGTPGHLASEHLDPALVSFTAIGTESYNVNCPSSTNCPCPGAPSPPSPNVGCYTPTGKLCGATTAGSLYGTNVPAAVLSYCSNYTISHTLLDLYIGGCTYIIFTVVRKTQPDTSRSGTDTYQFQMDSQTHRVVSCTKNGGAAQAVGTAGFTDCLNNAGYTTYYKFKTDRVIGK